MPEKTHRRASANGGGLELLFEFLRRLVSQRRMQTTAIVIIFNESFDVAAQVLEVNIIVGVDLFALGVSS